VRANPPKANCLLFFQPEALLADSSFVTAVQKMFKIVIASMIALVASAAPVEVDWYGHSW
jgi:hypothetical protein